MDKIIKLLNHIRNGSLFSRIREHRQVEIERKWRIFVADENMSYIIKKFRNGGKMKLEKDNLLSRAIYNEFFEANELDFINRTLRKGDTFIDVGANIGLFSIIAFHCNCVIS